MKNNIEDKMKEDLKVIKMTDKEKLAIKQSILNDFQKSDEASISKDNFYYEWKRGPIKSWIYNNSYFTRIVVALLIIAIISSTAVSASANTLPGDLLYPVKTNVVEKVQGAFKVSPLAKANWNQTLIANRLDEAETLADQGKLDDKAEQIINKQVEKNVDEFSKNIDKAGKKDEDSATDLTVNLEASLNAHASVLAVLASSTSNSHKNSSFINRDIKDYSNKLSKLRDKDNSTTTLTYNNKKDKDITNSLDRKKKSVRKMIDSVNSELNTYASSTTDNNSTSLRKQAITSIKDAETSFSQSDQEDKSGNKNKAYSSIIKSEKSTLEARGVIDLGKKFENKSNYNQKKNNKNSKSN